MYKRQGFESLLYVDGHPYQGVDTNHNEVIFRGEEGKAVRLTFLLWTGLEGGGAHRTFFHQCKQADVAYLHKTTDELYYFAKAITGTLRLMPEDNEQYVKLKAALDRVLQFINWEDVYKRQGVMFVVPALIPRLIFWVIPVVWSGGLSFTDWDMKMCIRDRCDSVHKSF